MGIHFQLWVFCLHNLVAKNSQAPPTPHAGSQADLKGSVRLPATNNFLMISPFMCQKVEEIRVVEKNLDSTGLLFGIEPAEAV